MINLIPPQGKSYVAREYILRVAAVWMLLLSAAAFIIALMLLPTYVLLSQRLTAVSLAYDESVRNDESEYNEAQRAIQDANLLAARLNRSGASVLPSEAWSEVLASQSGDIVLHGFLYTYSDGGTFDIQISGIATTREALVRFRDALERTPLFVSATVPVANLAKDIDVPFTMTLVVQGTARPQ